MTDEEVQSLSPAEFQRLTGVRRETFEHMVAYLTPHLQQQGHRGGQNKLSVAEQLLICLSYWREYRTYFHIAQDAGIHESTVCRIDQKVEKLLAGCPEFHLPGKKRLREAGYEVIVIVIDVTEIEIEQPKKTARLLQRQAQVSHPKSSGDS